MMERYLWISHSTYTLASQVCQIEIDESRDSGSGNLRLKLFRAFVVFRNGEHYRQQAECLARKYWEKMIRM